MAWPPPTLPTTRTDTTVMATTHPAEHNAENLAINDIVARLTAAAWGKVAYAEAVGNTGPTSGTTPLVFASVNWTAVAGRRYRVTGEWEQIQSVAADIFVTTYIDSVSGGLHRHTVPGYTTGGISMQMTHIYNASVSGARIAQLSIARVVGTGTVIAAAAAGYPLFIMVEDIGPFP